MFRKKRKLEFYDYHAASVIDCIGGVIVTMLASDGVDWGFKPWFSSN